MIKIYYNPSNGDILRTSSTTFSLDGDDPYIEHPYDIRICDYKVDLETKQLVSNPNKPNYTTRRPNTIL